jgi:hypothetical protein
LELTPHHPGTQISEVGFSHIDWNSHARAIHTFHAKSHIFLIKFLSIWPPIGNKSTGTTPPRTQAIVRRVPAQLKILTMYSAAPILPDDGGDLLSDKK